MPATARRAGRPAACASGACEASLEVHVEIPTPFGVFRARFTTQGLARLEFPGTQPTQPTAPRPAPLTAQQRRWIRWTEQALLAVLKGRAPRRLPPLDWRAGTPFQQRVWAALLEIPPGQTCTYGELARRMGRPKAARAVGAACGANPVPVLVPCHRVIAAQGGLGGFTAGLDWKRKLLALESQPSPV